MRFKRVIIASKVRPEDIFSVWVSSDKEAARTKRYHMEGGCEILTVVPHEIPTKKSDLLAWLNRHTREWFKGVSLDDPHGLNDDWTHRRGTDREAAARSRRKDPEQHRLEMSVGRSLLDHYWKIARIELEGHVWYRSCPEEERHNITFELKGFENRKWSSLLGGSRLAPTLVYSAWHEGVGEGVEIAIPLETVSES